jgi:starch-binding outer membrane protein, SusD/RagB family
MKKKWLRSCKCTCIASAFLILTTIGCKKLVKVGEPDDSLTSAMVFSNDSLAQAAVTGLYIKVMSSTKHLLCGGMSIFPSLSADELVRFIPMVNEDQFYLNDINSNNLLVNANIWKAAYTYIFQCNSCIEGLQKSTGVSSVLKDRLTGEVKFMRALCYYYLVNLYGDVPLALSTNAEVNTLLSRSPVAQVYKQVETDLITASNILTNVKENTLPTSYAAKALLARVYLHLKDWGKADGLCSEVINSGQFAMQINPNDVFKANSTEIIFQLAPVKSGMYSPEGFLFVVLGNGRPSYSLTTGLWDAFEPGDLRKDSWIKLGTWSGQNYKYPYKYKTYVSTAGSIPGECNVILRLAEQYLIRAEARAWQNKIEDAVSDINAIRTRAGLHELVKNISKEECLQAIEQERRTELFAEWGHRWIDLKRTGRANAVLSNVKSNWQYYDTLYPIPFAELETAPNIKQNPGYE